MLFKRETPTYKRLIESELEAVLKNLKFKESGSEDYKKVMDHAVTLHDLLDEKPTGVSKDTLALILGNLAGIVLIIKHEHVNVITSKAMGLVIKAR